MYIHCRWGEKESEAVRIRLPDGLVIYSVPRFAHYTLCTTHYNLYTNTLQFIYYTLPKASAH